MASPDRILKQRDVHAMAALDTMPHIVTRVRNLLAHNRRITITQRYTYINNPPEVTAGLALDDIRDHKTTQGAGIGVTLKPGLLAGFGIHAYAGESDTEAGEWKRYHATEANNDDWFKRRRNMTRVDITGGMPGDGPARDDQLIVRYWNGDGVCDEKVVAFDYGPDRQQQREDLARHLWIADGGDGDEWDRFDWAVDRLNATRGVKLRLEGAERRDKSYARADEILAVINAAG